MILFFSTYVFNCLLRLYCYLRNTIVLFEDFFFPRTNVLNCPFRSKVLQVNAYHQNEYVQFPSLFMRYSGHSCCISFFSLCCILNCWTDRSPYSHLRRALLGVRANVQPKSSILIGAKVEISPKGSTLFNLPQATKKCWTLWPCIGPKARYHQIWEANLQPLGPMFQHLLIFWHQCSSIY